MSSEITVRRMTREDWDEVRAIYLEGIATGLATFETDAPGWERWESAHLECARLVAINSDQKIVGWAALSPTSARAVYAGVAEVSVYVRSKHWGRGIGRRLLRGVVTESEKHGIWTLQAGIFAENHASLALHKSCGFREVGRRERIAKLKDRWHDTVILERRSRVSGID
jgi:phosphinothricin acetyltransferase